MNPAHPGGPDNGQDIMKVAFRVALEKREECLLDVSRAGWVHLQPDDTGVRDQLRYRPIAKMLVQGNENTILARAILQDLQIVRACHAHLCSTFNVMAGSA